MKLTKKQKIILLGATIGILVTTIVTPIVVINANKKNEQKKQNQKDVKSVVKILEEKSLSKRQIELSSDSKGKIIANNQEEIIKKIKQLIGGPNLKGVLIEISMVNDQEISTSFQEIKVKVSKGSYSQEVKKEKTIFVKREKTVSELALIELNLIKDSLKALGTKVVNVYTSGAINQKITTNKLEILKAIEKISGYSDIDFNGATIKVKDSENLLPINSEDPIAITLVLSKSNVFIEVIGFSAKQMSPLESANFTISKIKDKITDKDILIAPNVSIQNQSEIQSAIKNQLQKENPSLTNDDLLKISINLSSLDLGTRTPAILTFNVDSVSSTLTINVEKINLLKGSNIVIGSNGKIFQDEFKNLWAMGNNQRLQVLKANQNGDGYVASWTNDNSENGESLLKGSNINDGNGGKIFQDEFKNLWTMGSKTSLQVLRVNTNGNGYDETTGWTSANDSGLTNGSNINDGNYGTIFQDEFKNLWATGNKTSLQVLRVNTNGNGYDETTGWTSANDSGLTNGSNITDGKYGTIFQDEFKNLWTMGNATSLQVLKPNENGDGYDETTGWTSANDSGLTNGSNITDGGTGTIFQDQFKNLWTMGFRTNLQVLRVNTNGNGYDETTGWKSANDSGLTNGSNITDGTNGIIFQDEFKNLWTMGSTTPLQVLRVNTNGNGYDETAGWTSANDSGLTNGSNITDGAGGTIFQDEFKNLWTMGKATPLQVLKPNENGDGYDETTGWTSANDSGLTNGANIIEGFRGTIFQDKFKNLWVMSTSTTKTIDEVEKTIHTKLQVLKVNLAEDGYVDSWQKPID